MKDFKFDFYNNTNLKSYNLNDSIRYELAILDSLDVFTRLHSENVANLTCRICEYIHMKKYYTVYCIICAYLHDIGKQYIPSKILQKKEKLDDDEYEKIKTHTTIGYNICMNDAKLRPYAEGALFHHEALDGSGYPNHLTKKDIPLVGQIIRVADEFDAITSKRQYKSHIGVCDTLKILQSETISNSKVGKLNPKIVKALIKVIIDDTEYELFNLSSYIDYLKEEVKRLEQISIYEEKKNNCIKEKNISFYFNGITQLLKQGETLDNYKTVLDEYKQAFEIKSKQMSNLKQELKEIKRLKI